jgi:hypothetical protein
MRLGARSVVGVLGAWGIAFCVAACVGSGWADAAQSHRWPEVRVEFGPSYVSALRGRAARRGRRTRTPHRGNRAAARAHTSIAGGGEIAIASAPWQVEIFAETSNKGTLACGGSILDPTHILTAAHCAFDPETSTRLAAGAFVITAGIARVTAEEIKNNPALEARFAVAVRVHPSFQYSLGPGAADDVAVLTLSNPLTLDASVRAISLAPPGEGLLEGASTTLTGFGAQVFGVESDHHLNSLSMTIAFAGDCGREADAVFVCADSQVGSGCSGDSGSALTSGSPAVLFGVLDTVALISNKACQAGAINGFTSVSAPEIRDFIEGSEAPPMAPRGGKGVAFRSKVEEGAPATVGAPLTCEPGSWSGSPTFTFAFVESANGIVLQSGTSSTYTPTSEDVGDLIYCEVRASNPGGTAAARTNASLPVYERPPSEELSGPTIGGYEWSSLPAMSEPRAEQTATLLPDGDVLMAGGYNGFTQYVGGGHESLQSAELFHSRTGTWTPTGPMLVGRSGQLASLLADGEVLVIGGWEMPKLGEYVRTAELYDPATNSWTTAPVPAELEESSSLTSLPDGRVLLTGVFGTDLFDKSPGAAVYDPASNAWTRVASPNQSRYGATATLLPGGEVLLAGGFDWEDPPTLPVRTIYTVFASAEEFNPATSTWRSVAPMAHARTGHTATLMPDGEVFVTGGLYSIEGENDGLNSLRSTEAYDPGANRWVRRASTLLPRAQDTATLMGGGDVLLAGGYDCGSGEGCLGYGGSGDCCGASSAEVYDPSSDTWEFTPPVLSGNEHTATLLPGGDVLLAGGNVGPISGYELSSAELYAQARPIPIFRTGGAVLASPRITHLTESHRRWREGGATARISSRDVATSASTTAKTGKARNATVPLGTTFTFTLSQPASVTFTFAEQLPGYKVKGRCLAHPSKTRHARSCKRSVVRGRLAFAGRAGKNTVAFQGRVSRTTKLPLGSYEMRVSAVNRAGQRATASPLAFVTVHTQ